jgi:hypothetical protein
MMNAQKKTVIGLILVAAFGLAANQGYEWKTAQIHTANDAELSRRQSFMTALETGGSHKAACQDALQDLRKPYLEDRESYLLFWDTPSEFPHYGAAFKKSLNACNPAAKPFTPAA